VRYLNINISILNLKTLYMSCLIILQDSNGVKSFGVLSSKDIEEEFNSGNPVFSYVRDSVLYELDLKNFKLRNTLMKTAVDIRRRPAEFDPVTKQPVQREPLLQR